MEAEAHLTERRAVVVQVPTGAPLQTHYSQALLQRLFPFIPKYITACWKQASLLSQWLSSSTVAAQLGKPPSEMGRLSWRAQ